MYKLHNHKIQTIKHYKWQCINTSYLNYTYTYSYTSCVNYSYTIHTNWSTTIVVVIHNYPQSIRGLKTKQCFVFVTCKCTLKVNRMINKLACQTFRISTQPSYHLWLPTKSTSLACKIFLLEDKYNSFCLKSRLTFSKLLCHSRSKSHWVWRIKMLMPQG